MIDGLRQDLLYGWRQLRHAPLFTAIASVSVATAVIVAVSAFTVLNSVLLKPLPVPDPDGIYHVFTSDYDGRNEPYGASSYRDYEDFAKSGAFQGLAASAWYGVAASVDGALPTQEYLSYVSPNYFDVLRLPLLRGTGFRGGDGHEIIITHAYWQRQFEGDPSVIGRRVTLNSFPLTIVGVAPESFRGVGLGFPIIGWASATVLPLLRNDADAISNRGQRGFTVFGRLRADQPVQRAAQQLNILAASLAQVEPQSWLDQNKEPRLVTILTHRESVIPPQTTRSAKLIALGAGTFLVLFVVLLACTNVAALLLGRAVGRESEIAVRLTLGASRRRLIRQLMTESFLLAAIGGTVSVLGLLWTISFVRRIPLAEGVDLRPDWRVLLAALVTSIICALFFGLAPAYQSLRVDLRSRFGGQATVRRNRLRGALITLQVALSTVLILLAFATVRGVRAFAASNPGFELDGLIALQYDTRVFGEDRERRAVYSAELRELVSTAPGIQSASSAGLMPFGGTNTGAHLDLAGKRYVVEVNTVGAEYFKTVGLAATQGRVFDSTDRRGSAPVVVVNRAFLQRYGNELFGRSIMVDSQTAQIVGVVPEIQYHEPQRAAAPLVYRVDDQFPWNSDRRQMLLRVREGTEAQIVAELRQRIRQRFPDLIVPSIQPVRQYMAFQTLPHRIGGRVALGIGGVELGLASVGLYGLLVFALVARRREIGVRLALGASSREASWAVMRDGLRYAGFGILGGIMIAIPTLIVAQTGIPGARADDPIPFFLAVGAVVLAAAIAAYFPARRAGRVQPAAALRHD